MKFLALTACVAALALGACRREVPYNDTYVPMKLGATQEAPATAK